VLFVSVDTLRADVAYSGKFKTIERLRREGVWFENVVSQSPLTPVSHASIFSGLYPTNHGIRHLFKEKLGPGTLLLPEIFNEAGYRTCAVVSAPGLNAWYGLSRGFDVYDDEVPKLPDGTDALQVVDVAKRGMARKDAKVVYEHAKTWIESNEGKFFLFVHFFDTHWPYTPPEYLLREYPNPYEGEVAYADSYVGNLIKLIEDKGMLDETLVVLFSDHGEDLGGWYPNDKGGINGRHPEESGHGLLLYDTTQLVPLIFRLPNAAPRLKVNQQVRLIDIAPTVLELVGLRTPPGLDGVSLRPILERKTMVDLVGYSETFLADEIRANLPLKPHKAIRIKHRDMIVKVIWEVGGDSFEVYDVAEDRNETTNIALSA
jgi:arylsulfatase A-like enzyme